MSLRVVRNLTNYDECYTPCDQVLPLLDYLDKDKIYYEATSGFSSQIVDGFKKYEYNIMPSGDIKSVSKHQNMRRFWCTSVSSRFVHHQRKNVGPIKY